MVHRKEAVHKDTAKFSPYLREVIVLQPRLYPDCTKPDSFYFKPKKNRPTPRKSETRIQVYCSRNQPTHRVMKRLTSINTFGSSSMTCPISNINGNVGSLVARYTALIALVFGPCLSSAFAEEAQQESAATDVSEQTSRPLGEPLTDFEKMEIHHRRYSTAANNMAQLYNKMNQKIQKVARAAKTAEIKESSHNRGQFETKLRQLEMARTSYNTQYTQLYSPTQNESRNYATLSNNLKV